MTGPHLAISDCRKEAISAGVEPFGTAPRSSKRDFTVGKTNAALVSALSFAITSGGVFAGTKKANQEETSKPGTVSPIAGVSGMIGTRSRVVTASPRK